jgi:hypothetical protein
MFLEIEKPLYRGLINKGMIHWSLSKLIRTGNRKKPKFILLLLQNIPGLFCFEA